MAKTQEPAVGVMVKEVDGLRIRRLGNKDTIKLAKILIKHAKTVAPILAENRGGDQDAMTRGLTVVIALVDAIGDDVVELIADVAGMSKKQFEDAPFDTLPKIVQTVVAENNVEGFIEAVKNLAETLGLSKKAKGNAAPGSES